MPGRLGANKQIGTDRLSTLAAAARFFASDRPVFNLLTVDLRGWGDTAPAMYPYHNLRDGGGAAADAQELAPWRAAANVTVTTAGDAFVPAAWVEEALTT